MSIRNLLCSLWLIVTLLVFAAGVFNLNQILGTDFKQECNYTSVEVTQKNSSQSTTEVGQYEVDLSSRYDFDKTTHRLCIHYETTICGHVHFREDESLKPFQTRDYLILQSEHEFLVINKHSVGGHQNHLLFFLTKKQMHLKWTRTPKIHTFPHSNIFVYESNRLYITYLIEDRHITSCLFLEKVTPDYVQHIMPRDDRYLLVLSLPKHRQIMVQLFDCKQKRVVEVSKKALGEWVKDYKHTYHHQEKVEITLKLSTASGNFYDYNILGNLSIIEAQRTSKFGAQININAASCNIYVIKSRYYDLILKQIRAFFENIWKKIIEFRDPYSNFHSPTKSAYELAPAPRGDQVSFSYSNRIIESDFETCSVISLANHLIPTPTPVFHNIQTENLDKINSPEVQAQQVYFIENGQIHSEEYVEVYEVFPKNEVQWVAFTKTFVHFYPYNKQSKLFRYARMKSGGLVFQGSEIKGKWNGPAGKYEVPQTILTQPKQTTGSLLQAHVYYNGLFLDLVVINGKAVKVNMMNGFTGQVQRSFIIKGDYKPQNVFMALIDNEFFLSLYDPQTDKSRVTKLEIYLNSQKKDGQMLDLSRQYTIYSKIYDLTKISNKYYLYTYSYDRLSILTVDLDTFSNRRPHLYQKSTTAFEKSITNMQLTPFDNVLDVYGVVLNFKKNISKVSITQSKKEGRIYAVVQEEGKDLFFLFDFVRIVKNRGIAFKLLVKTIIIAISLLILPVSFILYLKGKKTSSEAKDKKTAKTEEPKSSTKTTTPEVQKKGSKPKKE